MVDKVTRILVVDDEATARLLLRAALEGAGFEVSEAKDGEDALRQFRDQPSDMVMLDVEMPGINGYEVCARLRSALGNELPIVMVTGRDDFAAIERSFAVGATDFIAKPVNWDLIGHRVRYLFRNLQVLQDLHAASARNAAILNALPDSLLQIDGNGIVLDARLAPQARGCQQLPRAGCHVSERLPGAIADQIRGASSKALASGAPVTLEFALATGDGGKRHFEARLAGTKGQEILCLLRDITDRKQSENKVYRLAYFDTLTQLPNRLSCSERLEREIRRARHQGEKLAVLFLDLDRFKNVNDTLGHGAGDLLLRGVAARLKQGVRPADLVARSDPWEQELELARLGGDEFTVIIPRLRGTRDALAVASRIRELMRRPFFLEGRQVILTTSIGIALFPDDGEDAATLLKHADTAMYHAKDQGRDNPQFYSASLTQEAMRRLTLESNLRLALERRQFSLVYQPQLDLASGRIRSLEALIRWRHPDQGLVSPMEFIPAAEDNGLVVAIGQWVLRAACRDAVRWRDAGTPLRVAVNLSAVQFRTPDLVADIGAILAETGLEAEWLELELTEGALMENTGTALSTLNALRQVGMRLALDDFGTGYSSLSYLKRLPLHKLKVDQSFVRGLPSDRESLAIVRAIVALAKTLGFSVIAEGVETLEQAQLVQSLECEMLQGYYVSKPVPAEDIPALLARHWAMETASARPQQ